MAASWKYRLFLAKSACDNRSWIASGKGLMAATAARNDRNRLGRRTGGDTEQEGGGGAAGHARRMDGGARGTSGKNTGGGRWGDEEMAAHRERGGRGGRGGRRQKGEGNREGRWQTQNRKGRGEQRLVGESTTGVASKRAARASWAVESVEAEGVP